MTEPTFTCESQIMDMFLRAPLVSADLCRFQDLFDVLDAEMRDELHFSECLGPDLITSQEQSLVQNAKVETNWLDIFFNIL